MSRIEPFSRNTPVTPAQRVAPRSKKDKQKGAEEKGPPFSTFLQQALERSQKQVGAGHGSCAPGTTSD